MSIKHKYQLKSGTAILSTKFIHVAEVKLRFHLNDQAKYHTKPATKLEQSKKPSLQLTIGLHNTSLFMKYRFLNKLTLQQLRFTLQLIIFRREADLLFLLQYAYCIPLVFYFKQSNFSNKKKKLTIVEDITVAKNFQFKHNSLFPKYKKTGHLHNKLFS